MGGTRVVAAIVAVAAVGCTMSSKDDADGGAGDRPAVGGAAEGSSGSSGTSSGGAPGATTDHAAMQAANLDAYMRSLLTGDVIQVDGVAASSDAQAFAEAFFLVAQGGGVASKVGDAWNLCASSRTFAPACLRLSRFGFDASDRVARFDVEGLPSTQNGRAVHNGPITAGKYAVTLLRGFMRFPGTTQMTVVVGYAWLETQKTLGCDPKTATYTVTGAVFKTLASSGGGGNGDALADPKMLMLFGTTQTGGYVSVKCYDASGAFETHKVVVV